MLCNLKGHSGNDELHCCKKAPYLRDVLHKPPSSTPSADFNPGRLQMLLRTEGVRLTFTDDALQSIAQVAEQANQQLENIGARRLYTILEQVGHFMACCTRRCWAACSSCSPKCAPQIWACGVSSLCGVLASHSTQ
jgi:hypothetical protein